MKTVRILALSVICVLSFCSCHKNYEKLALGKWEMATNASYFTDGGKRHYANDYYRGKRTKKAEMVFYENGLLEVTYEEDSFTPRDAEKKILNYHFDGDSIYVEGTSAHILKLNNKRMVLEDVDGDRLTHAEFHRIDNSAIGCFFANIWYSLPLWLWIVFGLIIVLIFIAGWDSFGKGIVEGIGYILLAWMVVGLIFTLIGIIFGK